jgi:hypothetical protein
MRVWRILPATTHAMRTLSMATCTGAVSGDRARQAGHKRP